MKKLLKVIILSGLIGLLTACVHHPGAGRYYGSSNNYYGQYPNGGYPNNRYSGYRESYPRYRHSHGDYYGYNQGRYCPERRYR